MRPQKAVIEFSENKKRGVDTHELQPMRNYRFLLTPFANFCSEVELKDLDLLTERTVGLYKRERLKESDNPHNLEQEFRAVRELLEWLELEELAEDLHLDPSSEDDLPPMQY
jgi:site-specific recombinase XerD